jgi:hypothetical protein
VQNRRYSRNTFGQYVPNSRSSTEPVIWRYSILQSIVSCEVAILSRFGLKMCRPTDMQSNEQLFDRKRRDGQLGLNCPSRRANRSMITSRLVIIF